VRSKTLQHLFSMKRFNIIAISILVFSALTACVTTKKKDETGWARRQFNNITTHYNYYFNANVLYDEAFAKLNVQHQDNYSKILDLYPTLAVDNPKNSIGQEMDKAIKKVSTAAAIHKRSDWVDNCYLLMGKSQFMKQDFETAEETFTYMVEEMTPRKVDFRSKNKKKKAAVKEKEKVKKDKAKDKKEELAEKAKDKKKAQEERKEALAKKKKEKEKEKKEAAKAKKRGEAPPPKKIDFNDDVKNTKEILQESKKEQAQKDEETDEFEPTLGDKDEKPKKYILKHRPSHQEAQVWLARTLIERKKYSDATDILNDLLKRRSTFPDVRQEAAKTYAYYYLSQKEYGKAILPLEKAIKMTNVKADKARMTYILAQIHQEQGRNEEALAAFERVLKISTPYEMEFNARMNVALFAYKSGKAPVEEAIATLNKMAKDQKNEDYKDQIYYTLAQIALKNNDRPLALQNLQLSLDNSKKNQSQKAESYLQIARLYLENENYVKAKCYYDSSLTVISKLDDRYDEIKRYSFGLTDIAKSIETITLQDSLIKIGKKSPEEKMALAKNIKKQREEAKEKAEAAAIAKAAASKENGTDFVGTGVTSTFFAYNPKSLQSGKRSFAREWGTRKLEDHWRRSNKKTTSLEVASDEKDTAGDAAKKDAPFSEGDMARILQGVPTNEAEMEAANLLIADAMLKLGKAYREQLQSNPKCIKTLEELNIRYPGGKNELESWYNLYLAYNESGLKPQAKVYYDKIVSKYPTTTYARILTDPNFISADEKEKRALNTYYKSTYEAFTKGQYKVAYEQSSKADSLFGEKNTFKPKFALLNAMAAGGVLGKEKYIALIKEVIAKFPETAEQKRAKEILRLLEANGLSKVSDGESTDENSSVYKIEDETIHYGIIVITDKKAKIEEVKEKVGGFTREYFRLDNLKITNVFFGEDSEIPLIVVRKFADKTKGMEFINETRRHEDEFIPPTIQYTMFIITQNNYKELLKSKSVDAYKAFYDKNYGQN
jgi:tetratricopeptide (TPR) repeat protein